jgi:hypothetical protein
MADPLYVLLQRALDDNGPEGDTAWNMFATRAKGKPGTLYFHTEDYANPMMYLVEELEREKAQLILDVERLKATNASLHASLHSAGIAPNKQKKDDFPWDKYPEIEKQAFEMMFDKKMASKRIIEWIGDQCPEAAGNTTFFNQRFVVGRPSPQFNIVVKKDATPLDWKELWAIGTVKHAKGWIQRVMHYGGATNFLTEQGDIPKDWIHRNPNDYINVAGRKMLRNMYHNGLFEQAEVEMLTFVRKAGSDGITRAELKYRGVDQRRFEALKKGTMFEVGDRLVHYSFAWHYPDNRAAQKAGLTFEEDREKELATA